MQTRHKLLSQAWRLAHLSNCSERKEAVLITDRHNRVLASGVTGTRAVALPPCACQQGHCSSTHAVSRALSGVGHRVNRAKTIYCTHAPCPDCINQLLGTPIEEIIFVMDDPESPSCMLWMRSGRTWTHELYNPFMTTEDDHGSHHP